MSYFMLITLVYVSFSSIDMIMMVISFLIFKILMLGEHNSHSFIFFIDEMSLNMIMMVCWIMMIVIMISYNSKEKIKLVCSGMLIMLLFFCVDDFLMFFIMFEFSLVPIFIMVVGFGSQPERLKSGRWMLLYTVLASTPLFFFIMYMYNKKGFTLMSMFMLETSSLNEKLSNFIMMGMILAMLVKVPMFFFHSWLPKAHVEAPLQGSMILAGVMLKMGLFGIIRMMTLMPYLLWDLGLIIFSMSILGSVYSCWMALNSDDVKVTVAYSSIGHMNFLISCIMTMKMYSVYSSYIIMVAHGLCSSMLFFLMTEMYEKANSRSIVILKGLNSIFPVMVLFGFISWSVNLSAPPSLSFIGEMFGLSCVMSFSIIGTMLVCLYIMVNSLYSIMNFTIQFHSSSKVSFKCNDVTIMVMISFLWIMMPLISLFFLIDIYLI